MLNILLFLLDLVDRHVIWAYGLCLLLIALQIRAFFAARQYRNNTIFPVEREVAMHREGRALSNIGAVLGVAIVVLLIKYYVVPIVDVAGLVEPTPTLGLWIPTPTPTPTATMPPPPTPTPRPTPSRPPVVTVVIPTDTPAPPPNPCPDANIRITAPYMGAVVSGRVSIRGTANHGRFQFYKVEFGQGADPTAWSVINDIHRSPVADNVLETLDTTILPNGVYWLRLTVVDQTGNFPPPCQVRITVQN